MTFAKKQTIILYMPKLFVCDVGKPKLICRTAQISGRQAQISGDARQDLLRAARK